MSFHFEKLLVYQKPVVFADAVCRESEAFPRGYGFLCDQLNRAALSIAASIAEGNGRFTRRDRRNFFGIARSSVPTARRLAASAFAELVTGSVSRREMSRHLPAALRFAWFNRAAAAVISEVIC
ncbi:hypothetical protein Mal4_48420 [Maioricimonas rarisocia]|uniref:Four helix bundle protein n=1 Tax=Maioricimonas rarisocia TaxID=2528026 RepID=A0A517ZDE0_9PLAN|nr:four helix bundle protein [Maioricimonas rarisocia]QDU40485.1 hypothetical protein Mal4_48420 [Maioricimonas rarisocia]